VIVGVLIRGSAKTAFSFDFRGDSEVLAEPLNGFVVSKTIDLSSRPSSIDRCESRKSGGCLHRRRGRVMKKFVFAVAMLSLLSGVGAAGEIVVPKDNTPFKIKEGDVIRIPVTTVIGAQVKAKKSRTSEVTVNKVTSRIEGKVPPGMESQEVEVKTNSKDNFKIYVTVTLPNGKEKTEIYEFEVE
jgi:hypothetical protein